MANEEEMDLTGISLNPVGQNEAAEHLTIYFQQRWRRDNSNTTLAQVLENHPSVTRVSLHGLDRLWGADNDATFPALCHQLSGRHETRANLQEVSIADGDTSNPAPAPFYRPFLQALTVNRFLLLVKLDGLKIYAEDLAAFLLAERSAPMSLVLSNVIVESFGPNASMADLTEAMESSKSIKSLRIHYLKGDAAQAILTGLLTNQSVETLGLSWGMVMAAEESSQSVHNILKDTKKIKRFILSDVKHLRDEGHEEISNRIATDLIESACVTEIEFHTTATLSTFQCIGSILREKKNLRFLGLPIDCLFEPSGAALMELLQRPKSPLQSLSVNGHLVKGI